MDVVSIREAKKGRNLVAEPALRRTGTEPNSSIVFSDCIQDRQRTRLHSKPIDQYHFMTQSDWQAWNHGQVDRHCNQRPHGWYLSQRPFRGRQHTREKTAPGDRRALSGSLEPEYVPDTDLLAARSVTRV